MSDSASTIATTVSNPDGVTGQLSNWIQQSRYGDIPAEILTRAKYLVLDGVACALVGARLPWSATAAQGIFRMEGIAAAEAAAPCTVIGWQGRRLTPLAATLLNSTFVQAFELDDYHSRAPLHSNALLLPALFAAAEAEAKSAETETAEGKSSRSGRTFSGADFLHAYVVGCEVGPRVGLALHGGDLLSRGWHSGAVQGGPATASAVAALLGLNAAQVEWALGLACTQAGGLMSAQFGSMAKRMQHGFAARNGLTAALLARENYTGIQEVFETGYGGYLSCFGQGASFAPPSLPEEIAKELGSRWELGGIRVKLHAAMAALHGTIDCVADLQARHPERLARTAAAWDQIESVRTQLGKAAYEHGGWIAEAEKPLSSTAAQMSVQFAAASQLIDGAVLMQQCAASRLNRPEVRALMSKVHPEHDPSIDQDRESFFKTIVTVRFKDGTEVSETRTAPKGIAPPASNDDIVEKWRMLVKDVLDDTRRQEIERKVLDLENLGDIRELIQLLAVDVKSPIDV